MRDRLTGRTPDFDSANLGSNPSPSTNFPLIEVQIYKLTKLLHDAEWDDNKQLINKLIETINGYKLMMRFGETHVVPF